MPPAYMDQPALPELSTTSTNTSTTTSISTTDATITTTPTAHRAAAQQSQSPRRKAPASFTPPLSFSLDVERRLTPRSKVRMDWDRVADPWEGAETDFDDDVFGGYVSAAEGYRRTPKSPVRVTDGRRHRTMTTSSSRQRLMRNNGRGGSMTDTEEYGTGMTTYGERVRRSRAASAVAGDALGRSALVKPRRAASVLELPLAKSASQASSADTKVDQHQAEKARAGVKKGLSIVTAPTTPPDFTADEVPSMRELYEASLINLFDVNGKKVSFGSVFEDQVTIVVGHHSLPCEKQ